MLLQLAIENYKSIRERVVWSMLAAEGIEHQPGQTVDIPGVGEVLRVAGLYGPNASGKSNIVEAWHFFCDLATDGRKARQATGRVPHKLEPSWRSKPTVMEAVFHQGGSVWTYGFEIDDQRIRSEWLTREEETVFERSSAGDGESTVEWGSGLQLSEQRVDFMRFVAEGTRPNQPLMAELRDRNATEFEQLSDYLFLNSLPFPPTHETGGPPLETVIDSCAKWPETKTFLVLFLRELGTGVIDVKLHATAASAQQMFDKGEALTEPQLESVREAGVEIELRFLHEGTDGRNVVLSADELSDGTRRLIGLSVAWHWLVIPVGVALVVDELDRSFHPALTKSRRQNAMG